MRTIKPTTRFRRDFKREKKGPHGKHLDAMLADVTDMLAADTPLPPRFQDHPLSGAWDDCRDCHVRPGLILIYRRVGNDMLQLVRLGSHSELGL
jgi:mRNA interferase YafQ